MLARDATKLSLGLTNAIFNITGTIVNGVITNYNPAPAPTALAINPTTGAINKGGFGAINGVRPARILQTVVRFVF